MADHPHTPGFHGPKCWIISALLGAAIGLALSFFLPAQYTQTVVAHSAHPDPIVIQTSADVGMQTMDQHLRDLYQKGIITYDEAMARAMSQDELKNMITSATGMSAGPSMRR